MKESHVDVIVVNWNGKHFLSDCLDSVYGQSHREKKIVLVDNGSDDGSVEYVSSRYKDTRIIALDENHGFTGANNIGIRSGAGDFVALLNNDAVAHQDWLKESVQCLTRYPDAGFCASKTVNFYRRDVIDTAGDLYTRGGVNAKRGLGQRTDSYNGFEYVFGACAAAVVYRREMLKEIGLFDEDFFIMCEDVDLSFRAQLAGYKCIYCPKAVVYHKTSGTIRDINRVFSYYGQRNLEYVFFKNMPLSLLVSHLPMHVIYNISALLYFTVRGDLLSFFSAKFSFMIHFISMLRKRRVIQGTKRVTNRYVRSLIVNGWFLGKIRARLYPNGDVR